MCSAAWVSTGSATSDAEAAPGSAAAPGQYWQQQQGRARHQAAAGEAGHPPSQCHHQPAAAAPLAEEAESCHRLPEAVAGPAAGAGQSPAEAPAAAQGINNVESLHGMHLKNKVSTPLIAGLLCSRRSICGAALARPCSTHC